MTLRAIEKILATDSREKHSHRTSMNGHWQCWVRRNGVLRSPSYAVIIPSFLNGSMFRISSVTAKFRKITLDVSRIRIRLAQEAGREIDLLDVLNYLVQQGVLSNSEKWSFDEGRARSVLHRDEIIEPQSDGTLLSHHEVLKKSRTSVAQSIAAHFALPKP